MNKRAFNLFTIFLICVSFLSCGDNDEAEKTTVLGDWYTTDWSLSTGDNDVDDWINGLLRQDLNTFIIKRTFRSIEGGDGTEGSVHTTSRKIDDPQGVDYRTRQGTYKIEGNVISMDEEQLGKSESVIQIGEKVMITEVKVDREYLVVLLRILGALTADEVPDGTTGTLKIREAR